MISHENFIRKLLAVSLCAAMTTMSTLLSGRTYVAEANHDRFVANMMFITKKDLLALCEGTNDGNGLLAIGTVTDVKLRCSSATGRLTRDTMVRTFSEVD